MENLKSLDVWCVWNGATKQFVGKGGAIATSDDPTTLVDCSTAGGYLRLLHDNYGQPYPSPFSIVLSLDAAKVISVALLNCYSEDNGICEGAAHWASLINSYTEVCWAGPEGRSVRIICKGQLPEGGKLPPRIQIATTGFMPLTMQRISARPVWMVDNQGVIVIATDALDELLSVKKQEYIQM